MHNAFADQQVLPVRTRQTPPERQPFHPFTPYNAEHNQYNSVPATKIHFVANRQDGLSKVSLQPLIA